MSKILFSLKMFSVTMLISMAVLSVYGKTDIVGAVFSATNAAQGTPGGNGVMMYHRHADGTLTVVPGSPFATGGEGVGVGIFPPDDPIGSQDSLVVDQENRRLFVTNAGSNQVSSFKIHKNGLELLDTVSSGGLFPNSLALRDNALYVLNAAGTTNFMGFKVSKNGRLKPCGNPCNLQPPLNEWPIISNGQPQVTAGQSQIGFSPDGKHLIVMRKEGFLCPDPNFPGLQCLQNVAGTGRIDVYALDDKLRVVDCEHPTSTINSRSPAGRMPFAFDFSKSGKMVVCEFIGTAESASTVFGVSAVSSYCLKADGTLQLISADVPNGETGACWIRRTDKFVYVSNSLDASISLYGVEKNGQLTLINPRAGVVAGGTLDSAVTSDGRFFYQLDPISGLIYGFAINQTWGTLTSVGSVAIATPLTGQAGLATFDFECNV